jgi:hypothetical protein
VRGDTKRDRLPPRKIDEFRSYGHQRRGDSWPGGEMDLRPRAARIKIYWVRTMRGDNRVGLRGDGALKRKVKVILWRKRRCVLALLRSRKKKVIQEKTYSVRDKYVREHKPDDLVAASSRFLFQFCFG